MIMMIAFMCVLGDHQCVKTDQILTYDRNQTELETIRANPSTYTSIPEGNGLYLERHHMTIM
jgi:hypothetical protein